MLGPRTLAGIHEEFPWDPQLLELAKPFEVLWHFELPVSAEVLWPHIADTSRMNRALGVTRMEFVEKDGVLHGSSRNAGVLQEWVEIPWCWVAERSMVSIRQYARGLAYYVRGILLLDELSAQSSRFTVYFGWLPRSVTGGLLLRVGMSQLKKRYQVVLSELAERLATTSQLPALPPPPPPELSPAARTRLASARTKLLERGLDANCVERMLNHFETGDDLELSRIQVPALARAWNVDERDLLAAFLHATRLGICALSWDVVCPHCRGVREKSNQLAEVAGQARCDVCEVDFDTDGENAIEITFQIHPAIRAVPTLFFCSAEPAKKTHIKLQQRLEPGGRARFSTRLHTGRYRARIQGVPGYSSLVVSDAAQVSELCWNGERGLNHQTLAPCPEIEIVNPSDALATFVLEDARWSDDALRPRQLFSFQQFRDLFGEEYVNADVQLSVGEQTILFTDVVGSTRLYQERGDPGAFVEVKRHFVELSEIVGRHHGAVVKTIGDAIMASFCDPVAALEAARDIHLAFPAGREDLGLRLRISMHRGPCIAVNLNTSLDYFGSTVNMAAKLQACAEAGEIALSEAVHEACAEYFARGGTALERIDYASNALGTVSVYRWNVNGEERT